MKKNVMYCNVCSKFKEKNVLNSASLEQEEEQEKPRCFWAEL